MLCLLTDLKMAHEQQKKSLEEEFEKIRLSLQVCVFYFKVKFTTRKNKSLADLCAFDFQDQVDTLTFQNRSLRDRAKRFEEALRKSTDEQIVVSFHDEEQYNTLTTLKIPAERTVLLFQDALAPYKHIDEDLKSLKEVLEMKNQQIHQQELKISELEKIVCFNFYSGHFVK